jgi:hypothetical protein
VSCCSCCESCGCPTGPEELDIKLVGRLGAKEDRNIDIWINAANTEQWPGARWLERGAHRSLDTSGIRAGIPYGDYAMLRMVGHVSLLWAALDLKLRDLLAFDSLRDPDLEDIELSTQGPRICTAARNYIP